MASPGSNIAGAMREAGGARVRAAGSAPGRAGTKAVTGHFPPAVRQQLRLLAAEQDRTMESLLAEALNMLFSAYNKPEIAPTGRPAA